MQIIIISILFFLTFAVKQLPRDYQSQIKLWKSKVPTQFVHSAKQFGHPQEICGQSQCEFFYFVYQKTQIAKQKDRNLTLLLVSGMNGKDILGPSILLQAYGKIDAARIIYFPFANPSGYINNTQTTYPSNFNVQNDFPIYQNAICGKTSAYKILTHLYSKYSIDMTIYVNDEMPIISYSWSKNYNNKTSKTIDQGIHKDIAEMLRFQANDKIKAANLYELNTKSFGNFVDWAYGGFKNKQILSKNCGNQIIKDYSQYKMNGLVFLLGVGSWNTSFPTSNQSERIMQRNINILQKMASVTNPKISFEIKDQLLRLRLSGCKTGSVKNIKIFNKKDQLIYQQSTQTLIKGDLIYGPPPTNNISYPKNLLISRDSKYQLIFQCDKDWINLGNTVFSKIRLFQQNGVIMVLDNQERHFNINEKDTQEGKADQSEPWSAFKTIGLAVLAIFVSVWIIIGIRLTLKIQKKQRIKNFNEKFENIEYIEESDDFSNHLQKEQEKPDLIEMKQVNNQETTKLT